MATDSEIDFDRNLGHFDCVLLSIGGMVGSAIFVFPGTTGQLTGPSATFAWALAGILMTAIALCYTELTLAFPQAGAPAVFPFETLGPWPRVRAFASYLEGVGYAFGWVFGITVSALAIADYLATLVPAASGHTITVALTAVVLAGAVNLTNAQLTSQTNLALSALLLAAVLLFLTVGVTYADPTHYQPFFTGNTTSFLAAVQIATTSYGAWTVIPAAVAEIRKPARTAPRAILLSLSITTLLYSAVVAVLHSIIPATSFTTGSTALVTPLGAAANAIGLVWLRYLLAIGAVAAIFTTMIVGTMSAGRVLFALGANGTLPSLFATRNRRGVPWVSVFAVTVTASVLATFPEYFYELLVVASIIGTGMPYGINLLSFIGLRRYRTDITPEFRVPGGLAIAGVAAMALVVTVIGLGVTEILWSVAALGILTGYYVIQSLIRLTGIS